MRCNKLYRSVMSLLLVLVTLLSMVGCGAKKVDKTEQIKIEPMEIEEVPNYSYDFIGGTDVMPIVGFNGPTPSGYSYNGNNRPDYYTDEIFKLLADTGVNVISYNGTEYTEHPDAYEKMFQLGEKYGVGIMVHDARMFGVAGGEKTIEEADAIVNEYANNKAYCGNYIIDEPADPGYIMHTLNGVTVEQAAAVFETFNKLDIPAYGNLLSYTKDEQEKFEAYIKKYAEYCNPSFLSTSNYPFFGGGTGEPNFAAWFEGVSIFRRSAMETGLPFWGMLQAGNWFNDAGTPFETKAYTPTLGETKWNANILLALGAKGISWFPMMQPIFFAPAESEPFDFQRSGLIGAWGNTTRWYYHSQEVSKQIRAVDEVLMNSVNKGIIVADKTTKKTELSQVDCVLNGTSWRELKDVSGNTVVGCFNYQGKTALYVVNYEREYAQKVTVDFVDEFKITVIRGDSTVTKKADSLKLNFAAGEAALIVFE